MSGAHGSGLDVPSFGGRPFNFARGVLHACYELTGQVRLMTTAQGYGCAAKSACPFCQLMQFRRHRSRLSSQVLDTNSREPERARDEAPIDLSQ